MFDVVNGDEEYAQVAKLTNFRVKLKFNRKGKYFNRGIDVILRV